MTAEIDRETCLGCGACRDVCPTGAIRVDVIAIVDRERCAGCALCASICPQFAISV